jgi:hypothetical protein
MMNEEPANGTNEDKAPAGWYPDPKLPEYYEQYYDGEKWTDQKRTLSKAARMNGGKEPEHSEQTKIVKKSYVEDNHEKDDEDMPFSIHSLDDTFMWALVSIPVFYFAIIIALDLPKMMTILALVLFVLLNGAMGALDNHKVTKTSLKGLSAAWAMFLPPFYLFRRRLSTGQNQTPVLIWLMVIALGFTFQSGSGPVSIDNKTVEATIHNTLIAQEGSILPSIHDYKVVCPKDLHLHKGEAFQCEVFNDLGLSLGTVYAEVKTQSGLVSWNIADIGSQLSQAITASNSWATPAGFKNFGSGIAARPIIAGTDLNFFCSNIKTGLGCLGVLAISRDSCNGGMTVKTYTYTTTNFRLKEETGTYANPVSRGETVKISVAIQSPAEKTLSINSITCVHK